MLTISDHYASEFKSESNLCKSNNYTVYRQVLTKLQTKGKPEEQEIDLHVVGSVSFSEVAVVDSFAVKKKNPNNLNADVDTENSNFINKCSKSRNLSILKKIHIEIIIGT